MLAFCPLENVLSLKLCFRSFFPTNQCQSRTETQTYHRNTLEKIGTFSPFNQNVRLSRVTKYCLTCIEVVRLFSASIGPKL